MIAGIGLIKKIRTDVEIFSYLVPEVLQSKIKVGQRVVVPFRSSKSVGIVWQVDRLVSGRNIGRKLKSVETILEPEDFIDRRQLELLLWVAEFYLSPLPTVLASVIPEGLSKLTSRTKPVEFQLSVKNEPQKLVLAPYLNYPGLDQIRSRADFVEYSQNTSHQEQVKIWRRVKNGEKVTVFGTYQPIWLPFQNLTDVTVFEPESELFKFEQTPKINVAEVARKLAQIHLANLNIHSYADFSSLSSLSSISRVVDISSEHRLLNYQTERWLDERLKAGRRVVVFYNLQDVSAGKSRFGIRALAADLRARYPGCKIGVIDKYTSLSIQSWQSGQIIVGTARLLFLPVVIDADLLVPNIDLILERPDFDPKRTLAQICKLAHHSQSVLIQTNKPRHPLLLALSACSSSPRQQRSCYKSNPIQAYLDQYYQNKARLNQFPMGLWIRLIYSDRLEYVCQQEAERMAEDLKKHFGRSVGIFGPSPAYIPYDGRRYRYSILINIPSSQRSSIVREMRRMLLSLPSPWSIDPHPVNLL